MLPLFFPRPPLQLHPHCTLPFHSICINRQYYQVLLILLLDSVIISSENILHFLPGRETVYPTFRVTAVLKVRTHCKCSAWRLAVRGVAGPRKECHFDQHEGTYPGDRTDSCLSARRRIRARGGQRCVLSLREQPL